MGKTYYEIDVFGAEPFSGNPVGVVFEADELSTKQMQDFARWTNLSETTFVLTPTDSKANYGLRIFTPTSELPFAGHPTLGEALGEARPRPGPRYKCLKTCTSHSTRHSRRMPRMARTWGPRRFFSWQGDGGFL